MSILCANRACAELPHRENDSFTFALSRRGWVPRRGDRPNGSGRAIAHTSFQLDRRQFLKAGIGAGIGAAGALGFGPGHIARALAATATPGPSPYGSLQDFDANGIALPPGFTSRQIARGATSVPGSVPPYLWHNATDGQATFATLTGGVPDGGWILTANSEVPLPLGGGVSGVEFDQDGNVERAYRVLAGTTANCAGGPAPWGRWLSCEEHEAGMVHECDPAITNAGVARPALGVFAHEAVAVDPVGGRLYLTEDEGDGCWYRFTPTTYPDLSAGLLEVATQGAGGPAAPGALGWAPVPNPGGGAADPTRQQVPTAAHFDGGEGTWYDDGVVYLTTKGDERVWAYEISTSTLEVLYDASDAGPDAPLSGVDNITVSPSGDIFVCEDGRDHDICMVTPDFKVSRFLKLDPVMHAGPPEGTPFEGNETVGVVFNPQGTRMYFGAQRSFGTVGVPELPAGVVYEVSGPFRQTASGSAGGANGGPPGLRASAKRRRHIRKFLRRGLSVGIELDQLCGVTATLRAAPVDNGSATGSKRRRKGATLARATSSVALRDAAALQLQPTRGAAKFLRNRRKVSATLEVVATNGAGLSATVTEAVTLDRAKPNRR
jgi:hypothetical protein